MEAQQQHTAARHGSTALLLFPSKSVNQPFTLLSSTALPTPAFTLSGTQWLPWCQSKVCPVAPLPPDRRLVCRALQGAALGSALF
jgi:hypothetical protein